MWPSVSSVPFAIIEPWSTNSTPVYGSVSSDALQSLARNRVKDVARRWPAGLRVCEYRGYKLKAFLISAVDKATGRGVSAAELFRHLVATQVAEALITIAAPVGRHRGEGARLVGEGAW